MIISGFEHEGLVVYHSTDLHVFLLHKSYESIPVPFILQAGLEVLLVCICVGT